VFCPVKQTPFELVFFSQQPNLVVVIGLFRVLVEGDSRNQQRGEHHE
jgi:hypothetical protein